MRRNAILSATLSRDSRRRAEAFYAVHEERPFHRSHVNFMTSGPVVVQVLEGENAIAKNRDVMGATDPAKAAPEGRATPPPRAMRQPYPSRNVLMGG
jgi:nucleoside diphosphate kinase